MARRKQRIYTRYKPEKSGARRKTARKPVWPLLLLLLLVIVGGVSWAVYAGKLPIPESVRKYLPGQEREAAAKPPEPEPLPPIATSQFSTEPVPMAPVVDTPPPPPPPAVDSPPTPPAAPSSPSAPTFVDVPELTPAFTPRSVTKTIEVQLSLARRAISPGILDGLSGPQTVAAIRAFQVSEGLDATGRADSATRARLVLNAPLFTTYTITSNDVAQIASLPETWLGKSQLPAMAYESVLELVAEKSHAYEGYIKSLNPAVEWRDIQPGTVVKVPRINYPEPTQKAAFLRIRLTDRTLQAFSAETNLLAHFPCSIAAKVEKRPEGQLAIINFAANPNYTFNPELFPNSPEARELDRKLTIQPGPNNPVGTAWIGLDKPGYGIHGTPKPAKIGRTESLGCFRLANWDAAHLLRLVTRETAVLVEP